MMENWFEGKGKTIEEAFASILNNLVENEA